MAKPRGSSGGVDPLAIPHSQGAPASFGLCHCLRVCRAPALLLHCYCCYWRLLEIARWNCFLVPRAKQQPRADLAPSLPFTAAVEGPPEALRSLFLKRPSANKGPPAARGVILWLVYSVAAAAAFLLALCFRRLQFKGGAGLLGGSRNRLLAGQEHPWDPFGGPPEGDNRERDDEFLSSTLEECLDMEAEMNVLPLPSQPLPPSESQAISEILRDLRYEVLLFENEQTAPQQTIQGFSQAPAPEPTYPSPTTIYEEAQWPGSQAWMWQEGEEGPLGGFLPPMPPNESPYAAAAHPQLESLRQEPPSISSAASAEAAALAAAAHPWHQHVGGLGGVGGPEGEGGAQWVAGRAGVPKQPSPSSATAFESFPLLQQQPQPQQPSSSQEAAAPEESGALSVSSAQEKAGSQSPPSKKLMMAEDKAKRQSSVQEAPPKKPRVWLIHLYDKPPPKRQRQKPRRKQTAALRTYNEVSASADVIPSTSGVSALKQSASSQETTSIEFKSGAPQAQPGGSEVGKGFLTVTLKTGETISFAHPPLPTPPDAPPHYRLPVVRPEVIRRRFRITEALTAGDNSNIWAHLNVVRKLLLQPALNRGDAKELVIRSQSLVRYMLTKYRSPVAPADHSRAKEKMSVRFLGFEALVNAVQLLGPAMHPEQWFPHLVAAVPTDYQNTSPINSLATYMNVHLIEKLAEGLKELKKGRRPSATLTTEIKTLLFDPDIALRNISLKVREIWRRAIENPEAQEEEEGEEEEEELAEEGTSSAED
ncbi:hypothetical protein Emag_007812 [Eimeria magna]